MTIAEYAKHLQKTGLQFIAERITCRPDATEGFFDAPDARHWVLTLRNNRGDVAFLYTQGAAHKKAPTLAELLECLQMDCSELTGGFEEWCSTFGNDPDSRKAQQLFMACMESAEKLKRAISRDGFHQLMECAAE